MVKHLLIGLLLSGPGVAHCLNWEVRDIDGEHYICSSPKFADIDGRFKYKADNRKEQAGTAEISEILINKCRKSSCFGEITLKNGNKSRFEIDRNSSFSCTGNDGSSLAFVFDKMR